MEKTTRADLQCIIIEERRNAYGIWDGKFSERKKNMKKYAQIER